MLYCIFWALLGLKRLKVLSMKLSTSATRKMFFFLLLVVLAAHGGCGDCSFSLKNH